MSLTSKVTLGLSFGACIGIVYYVHFKQWSDKQKMHDGVIRDVERQQRRKIENIYVAQQQLELGKLLKKQEQGDDAISLQLLQDSVKGET